MKKISQEELEKLIDETLEETLQELTATGDIAGYNAPMGPIQKRKLANWEDEDKE